MVKVEAFDVTLHVLIHDKFRLALEMKIQIVAIERIRKIVSYIDNKECKYF